LQPWGLQVTGVSNPTQLWQALDKTVPDLLILDLELKNLSGVDLCRRVRQDAKWGDLPILVITAYTDAESIQWAFAAGADDFVSKPIVGPELVTRVVSRLEQQQPQSQRHLAPQRTRFPEATHQTAAELSGGMVWDTYGNILLVDDQPENLRALSKILSRQGYKVRKALSGAVALESIRSQPPDLVILDVRMPEMNGYEVCATLKAQPATREIPILFLSALDDTPDKLKAFAVGGVDYITKPFQEEEVLARIKHQLIIVQQQRLLVERTRQLQQETQERQQSEATLYQLQTALQESETRFQLFFHRTTIALALIGLDDRWLQINPVLCRLLDYSEAELLAVPVSVCMRDQDNHTIAFAQLLKDSEQIQIRGYCYRKSQDVIPVSIHLSILPTEAGIPCAYLAQFQPTIVVTNAVETNAVETNAVETNAV
ncbi:MAG TPA: response regulator, partial [Allocoleopsis sp.]